MTGNPHRSVFVPCTPEMKEAGEKEYGHNPAKKHKIKVSVRHGSSKFNKSVCAWISEG